MEQMTIEEYVEYWKEQYGAVYYTEVEGFNFYFRLLNFEEYTTLSHLANSEPELDEYIAKTCVLEPQVEDWHDSIYAGFVTTLATAIKEESLLKEKPNKENDVKRLINSTLNEIDSKLIRQMAPTVAKVFPSYKLEEIKKMDLRAQVDLYAEAVWVLTRIDGLEIEFEENE